MPWAGDTASVAISYRCPRLIERRVFRVNPKPHKPKVPPMKLVNPNGAYLHPQNPPLKN